MRLCPRVYWRLYSRLVRDVEQSFHRNDSGSAHLWCLWLLVLLVALNFAIDRSEQQLVLLSATYFPASAIYEPHTAVALFNAHDPLRLRRYLICTARNGTHTKVSAVRVRFAYQPVGVCKWTAYIAVCPALRNLDQLSLSDSSVGSRSAPIPFRLPFGAQRRLGVAACFSPLFYMERWQIVLTTLEIYRHFGVQLQVFYVQSILSPIMDVLQIYRARGFAQLEPWASIELDADSERALGFDPNTELDWRNQASAHTDCLLKYKEATQFIIVGDLDDVLVPRLGERYIDEFLALSSAFPSAAGFTYDRFNTELEAAQRPQDYSLRRLVQSARISDERETGKYVVNTSRVESAWLHYPGIRTAWTRMYAVPTDVNIMVHLRNWTIGGGAFASGWRRRKRGSASAVPADSRPPLRHAARLSQLLDARSLRSLERGFSALLGAHAEHFLRLPTAQVYLPLIVDCYNRIFYSRANRRPDSCPGPVKCALPERPGLRCSVAKVRLTSARISWRTTVHFADEEAHFVTRPNGCALR